MGALALCEYTFENTHNRPMKHRVTNREFLGFGLASILEVQQKSLQHGSDPTLSVQINRVNDPESIISFTLKCYKTY